MNSLIFDVLPMLLGVALGASFGWSAVLSVAIGYATAIFIVIPILDRR